MSEQVISNIPCSQIIPGDNDRTIFNPADLETLAESIALHGLAQPITVRPLSSGVYQIIAGERRFRAVSQVLKHETISAIVRQMSDEEADDIMLIENIQRADLNPMDEARAYDKRMKRWGLTVGKIAKKANVPDRRITARIKLLNLVPEAQAMIATGQLGPAWGETLAPLDHNRQRIAMRYLAETEKPSLKELRAITSRLLAEQSQESMFDLNALMMQAANEYQELKGKAENRRFPVDSSLPELKRVGNIAMSIEAYIVQLLTSDDPTMQAAASIVGRVYEGLISGGMAYPPKENSPLDNYASGLTSEKPVA